jgi:hypothetical protein
MQVVVVETGGRPVVVGGDVAVWFGDPAPSKQSDDDRRSGSRLHIP